MARGRNRREYTAPNADTIDNARTPALDVLLEPLPGPLPSLSRIEEFASPSIPVDRRTFSFHEQEVFNVGIPESAPSQSGVVSSGVLPSRVAITSPNEVGVCVRRQIRREVMFAHGIAGRARRRRNGKRHYTAWSYIHCK